MKTSVSDNFHNLIALWLDQLDQLSTLFARRPTTTPSLFCFCPLATLSGSQGCQLSCIAGAATLHQSIPSNISAASICSVALPMTRENYFEWSTWKAVHPVTVVNFVLLLWIGIVSLTFWGTTAISDYNHRQITCNCPWNVRWSILHRDLNLLTQLRHKLQGSAKSIGRL